MELQTATPTAITERRIIYEQMGKGHLRVFELYLAGELISRAFTLESLASVLGLPPTTIDGRYQRGRLHHWKVDIPMPSGRPARGFPYKLLEQVIKIIMTPKAYVEADPNATRAKAARRGQRGELVAENHMGKPHYTVPALAEAFALSETTIRKKLSKAGLLRYMVDLTPHAHGGRPKKGFPERMLAQVTAAIDFGTTFMSEQDIILARATGAIDRAEKQAREMVEVAERAAIVPVNTVNTPEPTPAFRTVGQTHRMPVVDDSEIASWVGEIDALMAGADKPKPKPKPETTDALAEEVDAALADIGQPSHHDTTEAREPDMFQMQLDMDLAGLTTTADKPPSETDYAETVRGLLDKDARFDGPAQAMVAQARAYWQQRMGGAA